MDLSCVKGECRIIVKLFTQIMTFHFLVILLSNLPTILMETNFGNSKNVTFVSEQNQTWNISNIAQDKLELFNDILQIMEKLNMLKISGNHSGCFNLETVTRDVTFQENSNPRIGIHFYFEDERLISDSSSQNTQDKNIYSDNSRNGHGELKAGECKSSSLLTDNLGLDRLSRKQDDNGQKLINGSTSNSSLTDSSGAKQMVDEQAGQHGRQRGMLCKFYCYYRTTLQENMSV